MDSVLRKAGKLTGEEIMLVQQHPSIGRRILEGVRGFQVYLSIVELHHENWNGTGYPLHLCDVKVPLAARIVHVADAYDAMTSARPYRSALRHEDAMRELKRFAGVQFDPEVVHALVRADQEGKINRTAQDPGPSRRLLSVSRATSERDAPEGPMPEGPLLEGKLG
jgi:HD-GYP domain-containing protein (c-di-GMP phosphodiesterase class II)